MSWTNFADGALGSAVRTALNAFNTAVDAFITAAPGFVEGTASTTGTASATVDLGAIADDSVVKLHVEVLAQEQATPSTVQGAWIMDYLLQRRNAGPLEVKGELVAVAFTEPAEDGPAFSVVAGGTSTIHPILTFVGCGTDEAVKWSYRYSMDAQGVEV